MEQTASDVATLVSQTLQGVLAGTVVLTADGALPVEFLSAGDRIATRSGLRTLRGVAVQVVRRAAMVRIGTDTLGQGRPACETVVPAGQGILIRDWRAQALYGKPQAIVPAARLVDGTLIRSEAHTDVRLYALQFDFAEVIYAGGLELSCTPETVAA